MEKFFHYTKVSTLKLILDGKKLRFSSLSEVDDLEEKFSQDLYDYGKHIFVSCFTCEENEQIEIWNMYGDRGEGVRLEFENEIFNRTGEIIKDYNKSGWDLIISGINIENAFPVEYTDNEEKIYPKVIKTVEGEEYHFVDILGKYKRSSWKFQNEWRYKLFVYRGILIDGKYSMDVRNVPITYYDVDIKKNVINNLVITLGYNISDENKKVVNEFADKFNYENNANIIIKESFFKGKVK